MIGAIAKRLFGSANERYLKGLNKYVEAINAVEPELTGLSDEELAARTDWLKGRHQNGETLDDLMIDAFATVREAAKRVLGQRHFDAQLVGGVVLHKGQIAEMKTGEGKTLTATLAVYLNALTEGGVHVVTVNDYLAERDAAWMGKVYSFLGLSSGCIKHGLSDQERKAAYGADVTYGTNNELGFDFLRDNMKMRLEEMVQRDFQFAIVDEVDSILIDEARTPLIISGSAEDSSELYMAIDKLVPQLIAEDYEKDEKSKSITLTEEGNEKVEELLRQSGHLQEGNLYDIQNVSLVHHVNQAIKAHIMFSRDTDYIVKDDMVVIIDEFTGRMMEGRRYSEGLHQALEAKEGVSVQNENQTLASITFQNYFRMYPKLAGMTGTAMTEAGEFAEIYKLEVVEIDTNVACVRDDQDDMVFRTAKEKNSAIVEMVEECSEKGQPILVGTVSIEKSELLSGMLTAKNITHNVLNARHHEQEAFIIAQAGLPAAVTLATNMAGRGTDIQLGGNLEMRVKSEIDEKLEGPAREAAIKKIEDEVALNHKKVIDAGGLFIVGTERHESRRVDNQLRGRAGRQGDPGASAFFLSLEDDLMRIFGSERIDSMLVKLGLQEGEAIVHPWINKALEKAQQKVEGRNFEIRKNLLKFDDVMNDQRKVIYEQRKELMAADDVSEDVADMRHQVIEDLIQGAIPAKAYPEEWDISHLHEETLRIFGLDLPISDWAKEEGIAEQEVQDRIKDAVDRKMAEKVARYTPAVMRDVEKGLLMQILDQMWKEHLLSLDHLRQGIGLRAYAQRDPLNEYKTEAFNLFEQMIEGLRERISLVLLHVELQFTPAEGMEDGVTGGMFRQSQGETIEGHEDPAFTNQARAKKEPTPELENLTTLSRKSSDNRDPENPATWGRVSRNQPCPCGSGRKYKHCHGKV